jgi:tellurite resistance protein TerC
MTPTLSFFFSSTFWQVVIFALLIVGFLYLDIKTGDREKPVSMMKAGVWSVVWVAVSLLFAGYVAYERDWKQATLFVTAYVLEKSLAVDNLFVFMAIFSSFRVAERLHHRILHWGIIGALIFRAVFIGLGVGILFGADALGRITVGNINIKFQQIVFFFFGVVILWSTYGLLKVVSGDKKDADEEENYADHWAVRLLRRLFPARFATHHDGGKFFTRIAGPDGRRSLAVTPLFLCLVVIEVSDIMFAFDSVPAIFAVTQDPFLVYTSNIFAVLGLRSMYFLVAAAKRSLVHLEKAVFVILGFIGIKMLALSFDALHIHPLVSLGVILTALAAGVAASFIWPAPNRGQTEAVANAPAPENLL